VVPKSLAASRIWTDGGYLAVSGLIGSSFLEALKAEAEGARPVGQRATVPVSDGTEGRGGSPARAFRSSPGGEVHWALHGSPQLADALGQICGVAMTSTGGGTYSFYEQEGDFLALHRDVDSCDIALITCLSQRCSEQPAGGLLVFPGRHHQGLSQVRSAGKAAGVSVSLVPGDTAILLGGLVPHEVTPVAAGQERVVAINCYRLTDT
jgi:hypothetical protein